MNKQVSVITQGLLFDMDGVLISSIASVERAWRRWAKLYELPDADTFEVPHGVRARDIILQLRPGVDLEKAVQVIEEIEVNDVADLKVLPGVKALLEALPPDRWAIVTSSTQRLLLARLKAAGLPLPQKIISGDMVVRGKPDPEPYRRGAELLGLRPDQCVVVEDAPSGVGSGKAAGSLALAVLGTHSAEELNLADWIIGSLEDLAFTARPDGLELRFLPIR